jgi:tetratricopeptide (TPR) repeat protein
LYLALAATWVLLAYLVVTAGTRGGTVGIGTGVAWQSYALTQLQAIPHYLRLSLWPHPLVFDYGTGLVSGFTEVLSGALIVTVMLLGTLVALRRWPSVGFLGVWFFAILAPTSSVVPVASQTIAEHRMYLPLAAVIAMVVVGAFAFGKRVLRDRQGVVLGCVASATVVTLFSFFTIQRNRDYHSALTIWQDTVAKRPDSPRAHSNLGIALRERRRLPEAISQYEQALRLQPDYAEAHYNLGIALLQLGQPQAAIEHWEQAVRIKPDLAEAHYNLGNALLQAGRAQEAISHLEQALRVKPDLAEAHHTLAVALEQTGQIQQAIQHYEQALRINPDYAEAYNGLGNASLRAGRLHEAIEHYEQALRIQPNLADAHYNLALALEQAGQVQQAIQHYEQALRINPDFVQAQNALARARAAR